MTTWDHTVFDMEESWADDVRRLMNTFSEDELRVKILAIPQRIGNQVGEFFGTEIRSHDKRDYSDVFDGIEINARRGWCLCDALRRKIAIRNERQGAT